MADVSLASSPGTDGLGAWWVIAGVALGVVAWVSMMVGAQLLQLLMQVEENTRPR